MAYQTVTKATVLQGGVTREMYNAIGLKLHGIDEYVLNDDGVFDKDFQWELQDNPLSRGRSKQINVAMGRHWFATFYVDPAHTPSQSYVALELRKEILRRAHIADRCLAGLTEVVRLTYDTLNVQTRPDGSYAFVGKQPLCIRKEGKYRTDMDDIGAQVRGVDLHNLLHRFVPKSTLAQVEHLINSYQDQWTSIYEGQEALIYQFTKETMGGEKLYITVGNQRGGVTFQFNRLKMVDQHTLALDPVLRVMLKEFGDE